MTLDERFKWLAYEINPPSPSCSVIVDGLLDDPSVDLSQLTLQITEDGQKTETLTVARGQDCSGDGWRLDNPRNTITLCGSLCEDIVNKAQQADLALEFQFACL